MIEDLACLGSSVKRKMVDPGELLWKFWVSLNGLDVWNSYFLFNLDHILLNHLAVEKQIH